MRYLGAVSDVLGTGAFLQSIEVVSGNAKINIREINAAVVI